MSDNKLNKLVSNVSTAYNKSSNAEIELTELRQKYEKEITKLKEKCSVLSDKYQKCKDDLLKVKSKSFTTDKYNVKITSRYKVIFDGNLEKVPQKYIRIPKEKYLDKTAILADFRKGKIKSGDYGIEVKDVKCVTIKDNHKR